MSPSTPSAANAAQAPQPQPPLPNDAYNQPLPGGFQRVVQALNALGTLWIVALMVLINTDVLGRNLLNAPVRGVTELVSLSIVGIVFLQLADTLHSGRITRADVLLQGLQQKRPFLAAVLHAFFHLVGALLMATILWAAWPTLWESIQMREYVGAIGDFTAPVWPVRLVMLVGLVATLITFGLLALADLRRAARVRRPRAAKGAA